MQAKAFGDSDVALTEVVAVGYPNVGGALNGVYLAWESWLSIECIRDASHHLRQFHSGGDTGGAVKGTIDYGPILRCAQECRLQLISLTRDL